MLRASDSCNDSSGGAVADATHTAARECGDGANTAAHQCSNRDCDWHRYWRPFWDNGDYDARGAGRDGPTDRSADHQTPRRKQPPAMSGVGDDGANPNQRSNQGDRSSPLD
jgi:hypothetical protein